MTSAKIEILLVEDNPNDAKLTLRALRKNNLINDVHIAKDGVEALDFIFARNEFAHRSINDVPKVIFLDLKLPRINGIEVLEQIKKNERTRKIPVVVLTSSAEDSDLKRCYELGVNSYIVKPVEFEKFMDAVTRLGFYWLLLNRTPRDHSLE